MFETGTTMSSLAMSPIANSRMKRSVSSTIIGQQNVYAEACVTTRGLPNRCKLFALTACSVLQPGDLILLTRVLALSEANGGGAESPSVWQITKQFSRRYAVALSMNVSNGGQSLLLDPCLLDHLCKDCRGWTIPQRPPVIQQR